MIVGLRQLRMTAAEIAETLGDAALDRLGRAQAQRTRQARPDRARAAGPLRALQAGRARPHRRQEARPDRGRRRQTRRRTHARQLPATLHSTQPAGAAGPIGWEYVHVAVDDYSPPRLRRSAPRRESRNRDRASSAAHSPTTAATASRSKRVLTDNGSAYRSAIHALACRQLGIRHLRTRPRRPQTNGKAERFIRTLLNGWAYGAIYRSSRERTAALDGWLWHYNHRRRHSALGHQPPASRTNLLGSYS